MFTILKQYFSNRNSGPESSSAPTAAGRMTLDERKQFRREMLYQSIRHNLQQLKVSPGMYRFRLMNLDERQHRFIAMIEVGNRFAAEEAGLPIGFNQIEALLRQRSLEGFGLILEAIFWRVNETQASFERTARADDGPDALRPDKQAASTSAGAADPTRTGQRLSRGPVQQSRAGAGNSGNSPQQIQVDHLDYESDHAPLAAETPEHDSRYRQL